MAEGSTSPETKFPGVSVTDEKDKCLLFLKCANFKAKKKNLIGGALIAGKGCSFDSTFVPEKVSITVTVGDEEGKSTVYEYIKNMPEDINDKKSTCEVFKEERLKVVLVKAKPSSWERHARYLQTRD